ncbi:hypothetical protein F383_18884 [Gossypium arboreum]|uniref:Uncharacterized protein n=1 Tax=Gossypium arboreum TaxID=29729 RepID=A0A0B0MMN3_GOSAR|nr:hypothetical protein F383_18884 [Gossypium arboreum]
MSHQRRSKKTLQEHYRANLEADLHQDRISPFNFFQSFYEFIFVLWLF